MAYTSPHDLDGYLAHLAKPDNKFRQALGADLLAYLADASNPIECEDIGLFVDSLIPWMQSSNYKVSSNGIEAMTYLANRLAHDFRPYLSTVLPAVVDRLGDAKDTVREKAQLLLLKLLERNVLSPQILLEKLTPCFTHKNAKIREEVLRCLVNILSEHGSQSIKISNFIPSIVKLLSDSNGTVRDTAFSTVVELYKCVGERLKIDIQRKNLVPAAKLPALLARFDEARETGEMLPSAMATDLAREVDEIDRVAMPKPAVPLKKANLLQAAKARSQSAQPRAVTPLGSLNSVPFCRVGSYRNPRSPYPTGAVDEDTFQRAFEDVPSVQIFSARELNEQMTMIKDLISDPNKDWNKRVEALKKLRSLVLSSALNYEDFYSNLRSMEIPLQTAVKDLRSQVVREVCITIAFLSQTLGSKFDHTAECMLPGLMHLIQNSAKVVASAGIIAVRFIIQYTHYHRLIPIITNNLANSKSKEIRRSCCDFLEQLLTQWSTHCLEKHVGILQEAIKKGIADADPEARVSSRKAFRGFKEHFPDQAELLLQSLEPAYRKALHGELCLSSSSSSGSLAQPLSNARTIRQPYRPAAQPPSTTGSAENLSQPPPGLQRAPSLPRTYRQRSSIPVLTNSAKKTGFRSNSAIDLQAAQRAKARAQYAALARSKVTSGTASLQGEVAQQARPKKVPEPVTTSPERSSRTRSRNYGVSQSQPTSRSGSPSSRLNYATYNRMMDENTLRTRRLPSGIPRSTTTSREASRETSPSRNSSGLRRLQSLNKPPLSPASRPVMAQRILQQSREAESALAVALSTESPDFGDIARLTSSTRKMLRSLENHSDDSETSSVCSERSFDSFRRPSDSYSWSGSQQRIARDMWEPIRDISEIISSCASTVWQERKDGLMSLQHYLANGSLLSRSDLKIVTEIFTKMFMDSHTKVLSMFLDTLNELILRHRSELNDWLYVLLQRIFNKLGMDLLSSISKKVTKTLDLVRSCFAADLQLSCVYRFLVDNTQTPNNKAKMAVLTYLTQLCHSMEPTQFVSAPPAGQALAKVIALTQDMRSVEVRNTAKNCVIALFNCNTPCVTMLLGELPKNFQEFASQIVQQHLRKTAGSEPGSPSVSSSPKNSSSPKDELLNQEDLHKSIRRTTAEIQNYSFEGLGVGKLERNRDTTSQDSGISQMSTGNENNRGDMGSLEDKMEEMSLGHNKYTARVQNHGSSSLPYIVNGVAEPSKNGYSLQDIAEGDVVTKILEMGNQDVPNIAPLTQLSVLINSNLLQAVIDNFRRLLVVLLDLLNKAEPTVQVKTLSIFIDIFKCEGLKPYYLQYAELLILKVLTAHRSPSQDVVKWAETTAGTMVVFPLNMLMDVLGPVIKTTEYPINQAAIKMLTKVIETYGNQLTDDQLEKVIPGLLKAYDHAESTVRKTAVFCLVAIHTAVGEERMSPHLHNLHGSKRKLLQVYIGRVPKGVSLPTSPKNTAA